MGLLQYCFLGI